MQVLSPPVFWAQRSDRLLISIQLEDVVNEVIAVDEDKLTFLCVAGPDKRQYAVALHFLEKINPNESKQRKGGREYYFDLAKKEASALWWPRLLKTREKQQWLKIDYNRWKDEDEDDSKEDGATYDDVNLEDMMQQMGTGGDSFDPGDLPADSDDEDIPELN